MTPEQIKDKYESRIVRLLNSIRELLIDDDDIELTVSEGYCCSADDEFRWTFTVQTAEQVADEEEGADMEGVDVTFKIVESEQHDGEEDGVNFCTDIVTIEGRILGGMTPYNYTEQCWVKRSDPDAVDERFQIMERADSSEAAYIITEHLKQL